MHEPADLWNITFCTHWFWVTNLGGQRINRTNLHLKIHEIISTRHQSWTCSWRTQLSQTKIKLWLFWKITIFLSKSDQNINTGSFPRDMNSKQNLATCPKCPDWTKKRNIWLANFVNIVKVQISINASKIGPKWRWYHVLSSVSWSSWFVDPLNLLPRSEKNEPN